jgi:hypothetical protein
VTKAITLGGVSLPDAVLLEATAIDANLQQQGTFMEYVSLHWCSIWLTNSGVLGLSLQVGLA